MKYSMLKTVNLSLTLANSHIIVQLPISYISILQIQLQVISGMGLQLISVVTGAKCRFQNCYEQLFKSKHVSLQNLSLYLDEA